MWISAVRIIFIETVLNAVLVFAYAVVYRKDTCLV